MIWIKRVWKAVKWVDEKLDYLLGMVTLWAIKLAVVLATSATLVHYINS